MKTRLMKYARRAVLGVALAAGATTAATGQTAVCGGDWGTYQTAVVLRQLAPSLFVTFTSYVVNPPTFCSEVNGQFLLWGDSNSLISFTSCGATHYYAPNYQQTWLDCIADCNNMGYANIP